MHVVVLAIVLQSVPSWTMAGTEKSIELKSAAEDGFRFTLPVGWSEIPSTAVHKQNEKLRAMGVKAHNSISYAAQPSEAKPWFSYPSITVIVDRGGPISTEQFATMAARMREIQRRTEMDALAKQKSSGRLVHMNAGVDAEFDKSRNAVSFSTSSEVAGTGTVHAYTEIVATKYGYINLSAVSTADQQSLEAVRATYRPVFRTLQLRPDVSTANKQ
jgi:hypothetical protein